MGKNNLHIAGYTAILIAVVLWGASFVWTKALLGSGFTVMTIVLLRVVIASTVMFLLFKPTKKIQKLKPQDLKWFFLLALFEPFLYFVGESYGLQYVSPSVASAVIALVPIATAESVNIFYKQKHGMELYAGALISVAGIVLMSFTGAVGEVSLKGMALMLLAVFSATMYGTVLQKILNRGYNAVTVTTWQNVIAVIYYLPCFLILDLRSFASLPWSFAAVGDILILGILCSAAAFALYSYSASVISVAKVCVFTNAIPIVTVFISVLMHMEILSFYKVLGILVVVLGVIISQIKTISNKNES